MTMLSPAATYHAELRQQLESVGRAISIQRGLLWLARGLAVGSVIILGLVIWAWTSDTVKNLPLPLLIGVPLLAALAMSLGSLFIRHNSRELARRIDRAARLHERSTTALELGTRGDEFPLAVAQMRDAVEHLKRVDLLEAFPMRLPRRELIATFFVALVAVIVGFSPNPWLLRARASNPSITIAREQAQRVQRVADSLPQNDSAEIDALRQMVSKGAKTMDARSNEPDAALNALQDLEEQVQQMSAGDDQLSAALAAIASALAGDQATQALSDAINTGDMRQISQATKDLAQAVSSMSPQDQQRVAQALRDASGRAGRVSQSVSNQLSTAADGLQAAASAAAANQAQGDQSQGGQASPDGQQGAQAASDALNQLSDSAAAADARQRTASQLESSRNALERALGRTQSRSGSNSSNSNSQQNRSSSNGQGSSSDQSGGQGQDGSSQSQSGDQSGGGGSMPGADGSQSNAGGDGSDTGQGGGSSTGGNPNGVNNGGSASQLDVITDPQQVPSSGNASPDESRVNPYTSDAGSGSAQAAPESVQPSYSNQPTQGNDSGSIPLGLRDLVKDYFSSLDQK
jgi:hypothetical protein